MEVTLFLDKLTVFPHNTVKDGPEDASTPRSSIRSELRLVTDGHGHRQTPGHIASYAIA